MKYNLFNRQQAFPKVGSDYIISRWRETGLLKNKSGNEMLQLATMFQHTAYYLIRKQYTMNRHLINISLPMVRRLFDEGVILDLEILMEKMQRLSPPILKRLSEVDFHIEMDCEIELTRDLLDAIVNEVKRGKK